MDAGRSGQALRICGGQRDDVVSHAERGRDECVAIGQWVIVHRPVQVGPGDRPVLGVRGCPVEEDRIAGCNLRAVGCPPDVHLRGLDIHREQMETASPVLNPSVTYTRMLSVGAARKQGGVDVQRGLVEADREHRPALPAIPTVLDQVLERIAAEVGRVPAKRDGASIRPFLSAVGGDVAYIGNVRVSHLAQDDRSFVLELIASGGIHPWDGQVEGADIAGHVVALFLRHEGQAGKHVALGIEQLERVRPGLRRTRGDRVRTQQEEASVQADVLRCDDPDPTRYSEPEGPGSCTAAGWSASGWRPAALIPRVEGDGRSLPRSRWTWLLSHDVLLSAGQEDPIRQKTGDGTVGIHRRPPRILVSTVAHKVK